MIDFDIYEQSMKLYYRKFSGENEREQEREKVQEEMKKRSSERDKSWEEKERN